MMKFNQAIGIGIMFAAIVLFVLGFAYASAAEQALLEGHEVGPSGECTHDDGRSCPFVQLNTLASLKYAGLFADIALFTFGLVLFLKKSPEEKAVSKARKAAKGLGSEESTMFDLIAKADGMIFQNELVEKTGLSKVKVTRILDKLEAKGIIERRRRGMTNAVILK
ncbi:MarR family transcriptional regulator [Candidatus Woesearchaeota archaeon]|nr:MarR family transcriptional regulator [Candidatus Woesearchaeota archaeon]